LTSGRRYSGDIAINLQDFNNSLSRFSTVKSLDEITALCRFYSRQLGFDAFIYALRIPSQFSESRVVVINGYPDAWLERYWEQDYALADPVVAFCSQHTLPILWHELQMQKKSPSAKVMLEAGDFGLKGGVSMPVHSPQGEMGILSFTLNNSNQKSNREITQEALPYVQLLASHVHEAVRRVLALVDPDGREPLTIREQECLRWAADGKTSWEISQLLGISERTVNFHLNNSMIKMDVCNRQHAIARAILQGLINPHPF
jgi:DNA-binding CsgD family transcriptional regulator